MAIVNGDTSWRRHLSDDAAAWLTCRRPCAAGASAWRCAAHAHVIDGVIVRQLAPTLPCGILRRSAGARRGMKTTARAPIPARNETFQLRFITVALLFAVFAGHLARFRIDEMH